jgi:hypothetical protein
MQNRNTKPIYIVFKPIRATDRSGLNGMTGLYVLYVVLIRIQN